MSWCEPFAQICRPDQPLRDLTWYRLGGAARWLIEPRDELQLAQVIHAAQDAGVPWRVLGQGANVLVRDAGFDGAVIRLRGPCFEEAQFEQTRVLVGAGADAPTLIRNCLRRGLLGLEVLAGIPGTVGGLIRMNAGGRFGEIGQFVQELSVLDPSGAQRAIPSQEAGFRYRHTGLQGYVIVGAVLQLSEGNPSEAEARHREIWKLKAATQPALAQRSAGCIFKNPSGHSAGQLLDQAGLKGARVGDAQISERHANFIVAGPQATSAHVLDLIQLARERVSAVSGVELQLEVDVW